MRTVQAEQLKKKDNRVQRIFETFINLKVLKLHVWEATFERIVGLLRLEELVSVRSFITLQAFQGFIWNSAVSLVAFASFSAYSILDAKDGEHGGHQGLSAQTVFVSIALLNTMRSAFRLMPSCVTAWSQSSASIKRIDDFLNCQNNLAPKCNNFSVTNGDGNKPSPQQKDSKNNRSRHEETNVDADDKQSEEGPIKVSKNTAIILKNCDFATNETNTTLANHSIENDEKPAANENENNDTDKANGECKIEQPLLTPSLTNISMSVEKGEIIGVVGAMASGKSTLISALMGELRKIKGTFVVADKLINVPNVPWMKSGTIRDNILFGSTAYGDNGGAVPSETISNNDAPSSGTQKRPKLYEKVSHLFQLYMIFVMVGMYKYKLCGMPFHLYNISYYLFCFPEGIHGMSLGT